jgi:hypothetical protein
VVLEEVGGEGGEGRDPGVGCVGGCGDVRPAAVADYGGRVGVVAETGLDEELGAEAALEVLGGPAGLHGSDAAGAMEPAVRAGDLDVDDEGLARLAARGSSRSVGGWS